MVAVARGLTFLPSLIVLLCFTTFAQDDVKLHDDTGARTGENECVRQTGINDASEQGSPQCGDTRIGRHDNFCDSDSGERCPITGGDSSKNLPAFSPSDLHEHVDTQRRFQGWPSHAVSRWKRCASAAGYRAVQCAASIRKESETRSARGNPSVPPAGVPIVDRATGRGCVPMLKGLTAELFATHCDGVWPVLLKGEVERWPSFHWTLEDLVSNYSSATVTAKKTQGSLQHVEGGPTTLGEFYKQAKQLSRDWTEGGPWAYLEDESFIQDRATLKDGVQPVPALGEDYFQLLPESLRPWPSLLLWGTAGSRSSLHIDPYNWTGTSAVLSGRKRWKLFLPGQDDVLKVSSYNRSHFPLDCFHYRSPIDSFSRENDVLDGLLYLEFEVERGELLVIPPGWLHQAFNPVETLAISGQLMSGGGANVALEEIIKFGHVDRNELPVNLKSLPTKERVQTVFSKIAVDL